MNCSCCSRPLEGPPYVVLDHDHKTGKRRDYICQSCNHLVGRFERGATIRKPVPYIKEYVMRHNGSGDYAI